MLREYKAHEPWRYLCGTGGGEAFKACQAALEQYGKGEISREQLMPAFSRVYTWGLPEPLMRTA